MARKDISESLAEALTAELARGEKPEAEVMVVEFLTDRQQPVKVAVERDRVGNHHIALTAPTVLRMDAESVETFVQALELAVAGLLREDANSILDL